MKQLFITLLAICGAGLAAAATGNNNGSAQNGTQITLSNADSWVSDGVFAISFELGHPLNQIPYFEFNIVLGDGTSSAVRVDIAASSGTYESLSFTSNHQNSEFNKTTNPVVGMWAPDMYSAEPLLPDSSGPFIVQYNQNEDYISFSYVKDDSILELASITLKPEASLPTTIDPSASGITFTTGESVGQPSDAYGTVDNVTTWDGEVSAENVQNPPPAAPAVPEPATATLSLLALCGLAARRRRK